MAERRARLQQGWSALTHAHRNTPFQQGPLLPSFSRELPVPDPSQFTPLSLHPLPPNPPSIPSFAGVVKQNQTLSNSPLGSASLTSSATPGHDNGTDGFQEVEPLGSHAQAVSRLLSQHSWAEPNLISDILQTLNLDENAASAFLLSMSNENIERVSANNEAECCSSTQIDDNYNEDCGRVWATEENPPGPDAERDEFAEGRGSLSCRKQVPIEPEWEEDDIYLHSRRDALRMSRASGKHARGAYRAFMSGDYSEAKILSKQAREERIEAEKLHTEAAKQILQARNGETPMDVWRLDLHGLHVNEAVSALQQRLLEIEAGLLNPMYVQDGPLSQRSSEKAFQGSALQGFSFSKELKVITGVGNHSRGGGSLPMAIQSFLIQNRYKFEELKPGVVAVRPKFHLSKGE